MKNSFKLIVTVALFGVSCFAQAESTKFVSAPKNQLNANYVSLNFVEPYNIYSKGIIETGKDFKGRGFESEGVSGDISVGRNLTEFFRTEVSLGYRSFKYKNVESASGDTDTDTQKTRAYTLMFNQNIDTITIGNRFTPYITAGLGLSRLKSGDIKNVLNTSGTISSSTFKMKNSTNLIWQMGIGASFKVTDRVLADVNIKRVDYGSMKHAYNAKVKLKANEFAAGVRFNF